MTSPTQRSLKHLRDLGYTAQIVEKYNMFAHVRQDLFGFIDIVAIHPDKMGVFGIQTTTQKNVSTHLEKIKNNPIHRLWIETGNKLIVHGWAKRGKAKKRKMWSVKEIEI